MISFIVAYKNLIANRPENSEGFLEMMDEYIDNSVECIVSDYGSNDGIKDILTSYDIKYIYTEPNPGQWLNIPKCYNHATIVAKNPIIAPLGMDFRFEEDLIYNCINFFDRLGQCIIRPTCLHLDKHGNADHETFSPYLILKETLLKSRGWDERMHGWGKEEDDLIWRIYKYMKLFIFNIKGIRYIHKWHPPTFRNRYNVDNSQNYIYAKENDKTKGASVKNSYW